MGVMETSSLMKTLSSICSEHIHTQKHCRLQCGLDCPILQLKEIDGQGMG